MFVTRVFVEAAIVERCVGSSCFCWLTVSLCSLIFCGVALFVFRHVFSVASGWSWIASSVEPRSISSAVLLHLTMDTVIGTVPFLSLLCHLSILKLCKVRPQLVTVASVWLQGSTVFCLSYSVISYYSDSLNAEWIDIKRLGVQTHSCRVTRRLFCHIFWLVYFFGGGLLSWYVVSFPLRGIVCWKVLQQIPLRFPSKLNTVPRSDISNYW